MEHPRETEKYRASDKGDVNSAIETGRSDYITEVKDGKIYDPLGKDLDNDGIIDRYDNDFRDSDYFESTYDVEDNLPFAMKGDKNMDYKTMRNQIEDMAKDNHKNFIKAVISMEKGINDENALDKLYEAYMDNDTVNLLHEEFDYMIEDLREQGQIKDLP